MLADAHSLLGRLQRGRGDAVRELLAMPRAAAAEVLLASLCTLGTDAHLAHRDLVEALAFDVTPWLRWLEAVPAASDEDDVLLQWNLAGDLAVRGNRACDELLRRHVRTGAWWRLALSQFLVDELELDAATWLELASRLDDGDIGTHVYCRPHAPVWAELARTDPRFARILQRHAAHAAQCAWSPANYAAADRSSLRWRVLEDLLRRDANAARSLVVDGLWDGSAPYRERCIEHCELDVPGVRARLHELAAVPETEGAARRRLGLA